VGTSQGDSIVATQRQPVSAFEQLPPQNIDAERCVLGAMMLNNEVVGSAFEILRDEAGDVFYHDPHRHIYAAMLTLYKHGTPIDMMTLLEQLNRKGTLEKAGGPAYLADISGAVPTAANIEHYANIVLDNAILRKLIESCTAIAGKAYKTPEKVSDLLDEAETAIFKIAEKRQLTPIHKVSDLLEATIKHIEFIIKSRSGITGIPTGFSDLDEMTSGFQKSDMVVIAARPSVGKTAFALNIASNAALRNDKNVLLFSLEMSKEQLVLRLICMEGNINSRRLRTGFLAQNEFPKLTEAADKLSRASIYIDDTPGIGMLDLRSKARRHALQHGLDMVIIDYLQLMSPPSTARRENRQVEIAEISRGIKGIARELDIPVIALSQLSREAEKDDLGQPKLSHLRESGAIEQDADVVIMLARPPKSEQEENRDLINVSLAKQRNGPTGEFKLMFDRNLQRFKNLTDGDRGPNNIHHFQPPPDIEERYAEDDDDIPF
jgi:replicative DNA helicase